MQLSKIAALLVVCGLAVPIVSALPAEAVTISINSIDYDVTVFTGSYATNQNLFQVPPAGKSPWWVDSTGNLALSFAQIVYDQLGEGTITGYGPIFAYDASGTNILGIAQSLTDVSSQIDQDFSSDSVLKYAIASPLSQGPLSNAPGPLPVLGVLGAFTYSKRLRLLIRNRP